MLWGLGSCDMKGGVAVLLELATTVAEPAFDVTYVFYECEEVDSRYNGIERLFGERPGPAGGRRRPAGRAHRPGVEAGCQGTMRDRGHHDRSAGPHRPGLAGAQRHPPAGAPAGGGRRLRGPPGEIDGCQFREGLQVVRVGGGVANNVVPDSATVTLNHRFAPDRTLEEAEASVR